MNKKPHGNTFKRLSKHGKAANRFPKRRAFQVSLATSARIFTTMLTRLQFDKQNKAKKTTKNKIKLLALSGI